MKKKIMKLELTARQMCALHAAVWSAVEHEQNPEFHKLFMTLFNIVEKEVAKIPEAA